MQTGLFPTRKNTNIQRQLLSYRFYAFIFGSVNTVIHAETNPFYQEGAWKGSRKITPRGKLPLAENYPTENYALENYPPIQITSGHW